VELSIPRKMQLAPAGAGTSGAGCQTGADEASEGLEKPSTCDLKEEHRG